jgi:hypothetical protein
MSLCPSGILMSALSLALILADIYHDRINYIAEHAILGGILSILFFTMCSYGYEIINWVFLALIPIFIFFKWIFSKSEIEEEECDECKAPKKSCDCPPMRAAPEPKKFKKPITCPAKGGIKMGDECGVSRFT